MKYLNVEDFLATESEIKITALKTLDFPVNIPENTQFPLPFYLISFLIEHEHCDVSFPFIDDSLKEDLLACSYIVNLNEICDYSYLKCLKLKKILAVEGKEKHKYFDNFEEQTGNLQNSFNERMGVYSQELGNEEVEENMLKIMDKTERSIFLRGQLKFLRFSLKNCKSLKL